MLLILFTNLFFVLTLFTYTNWNEVWDMSEKTNSLNSQYEIEGIHYPKDILQIDRSLFLQTEKRLIEFDLDEKEIVSILSIEVNTVIDNEGGDVYVCSWENFLIEDPSEYATLIKWQKYPRSNARNGLNNNSKEIEVYKTVRPVVCRKEIIYAANAYDILEAGFYEISVDTEELKSVNEFASEPKDTKITGVTVTEYGRILVNNTPEDVGDNDYDIQEKIMRRLEDFKKKRYYWFSKLLKRLPAN